VSIHLVQWGTDRAVAVSWPWVPRVGEMVDVRGHAKGFAGKVIRVEWREGLVTVVVA